MALYTAHCIFQIGYDIIQKKHGIATIKVVNNEIYNEILNGVLYSGMTSQEPNVDDHSKYLQHLI